MANKYLQCQNIRNDKTRTPSKEGDRRTERGIVIGGYKDQERSKNGKGRDETPHKIITMFMSGTIFTVVSPSDAQ